MDPFFRVNLLPIRHGNSIGSLDSALRIVSSALMSLRSICRPRELRKSGNRKIKFQEQPLKVLATLLARPGELVTREQSDRELGLWSDDTFVDFDRGLNTAVNRLRAALDDSAEPPRFVETVGSRGYRFIAPVTNNGSGKTETAAQPQATSGRVYDWPSVSAEASTGITGGREYRSRSLQRGVLQEMESSSRCSDPHRCRSHHLATASTDGDLTRTSDQISRACVSPSSLTVAKPKMWPFLLMAAMSSTRNATTAA